MNSPENLQKAKQITISGESGYVPATEEYKDTLIITDHSIDYECNPYEPWKMNPVQKWSYSTNSFAFKKLFELAADALHAVFLRDPQCPGTDLPFMYFTVTYEDGKTVKKTYSVNPDEFSGCFDLVKKMVPPSELIPGVLQTSEDYQQRRIWHNLVEQYDETGMTYEESAALVESMWDLAFMKKTECKCPRCGSVLEFSPTESYLLVYCNTEGCFSYIYRLNQE